MTETDLAPTTRTEFSAPPEHTAWSLGTGAALVTALLCVLASAGSIAGAIFGPIAISAGNTAIGVALIVIAVVLLMAAVTTVSMIVIVAPGQSKVIQLFGRYLGTLRRPGLSLVAPFTNRSQVSLRIRNFETGDLKVNDADGNPVNVAAIVVWEVADTARAQFAVEDYEEFIATQSEAALRHVATTHPYDGDESAVTLRGSTDIVADELERQVHERVTLAGLRIIEARISHLAYAPEIAQAMLQRQQASAVVAARETIVEGAVGLVDRALTRLEVDGVVEFDDERRAAMVSNLLVVLCGDSRVTPVVNTGSLYN